MGIPQPSTAAVMALAPEDVRYLRHWQVSIQRFRRDPDLDLVCCLRLISERIVPQLVPAINLEEHSKQTKFSACDEFASEMWAGYLEGMIRHNDKELAAIFRRVSEEVMIEKGLPNTMKLGAWVHPYKLIGYVCKALATNEGGRRFLNRCIYSKEFRGLEENERASGTPLGSSLRPREARIADVIASMANSHGGRSHLRDCVLTGKEELFGWRVGDREITVALSERGCVPKHDETDDIFITIHLNSIPEPVIAGRHPDTPRTPDRPTGGMTTHACAPYADNSSPGPVMPVREPERRPATTRPPTRPSSATPRAGATRFPLSDPVLNEVLNGRSVMEHLSAFQITDEELDLSRRVIEGELNLEAAMDQLQELFRRMPTSRRPSGGPAGGQPPVSKCAYRSC